MRAYLLLIGLLGILAGCSADWDPASPPPAHSVGATEAGIARQALRILPDRDPADVAALPDRGDLVAYDRSRTPVQRGAYTWHPVQLSEQHALRAVVGGELVITGPNGQLIRLRLDRHVEHPDGNWTWIGRTPGSAPGTEAIITFGAEAVFGTIPYGDQEPLRLMMSAGRAWLVETDRAVIARMDNAGTRPREPDFLPAPSWKAASSQATHPTALAAPVEAMATAAAATTVDVVLGYTGSFAARLGGQSQAVTRLTYLVDVTNQAYANSQVSAQLRLVRTQQVTYPDATSNRQALYDLTGVQCTGSDDNPTCTQASVPAALQPLHAARNQHGGDLVSLVRNFNDPENGGCGIAWLNGAGLTAITKSDAVSGMSVVSDSGGSQYPDDGYICRDETLAHELGHNMGSAHDRNTADGDDNVLQQIEKGAFEYSFGYKTASGAGNFYTIMAYGDAGQARYRVFSNPGITGCGGWPCGVVDQADNARSLRQTVPIVATFRDAPALPPAPARVLLKELDANGNGTSDLLLRSHTAARFVTWYMSGTTRTAYTGTALANGYSLAGTGDFNGDRRTDLMWTSPARDIVLSISTGTGYANYLTPYVYGAGTQILGAADINGNGKADILLREATAGKLYVWFMDGTTRIAYNVHNVAATQEFVGSGDLNKDGRQDLVWTNPQRNVMVGLSAGVTFSTSQTGLVYNSDYDLVGVTDVNGNGTADLILRSASLASVVTWFMDGTTRVAYSNKGVNALYRLVGKGDFNGDRRGDLAWTNNTGGIMLSLSTGTNFSDSVLAYTYSADYSLMDAQ